MLYTEQSGFNKLRSIRQNKMKNPDFGWVCPKMKIYFSYKNKKVEIQVETYSGGIN